MHINMQFEIQSTECRYFYFTAIYLFMHARTYKGTYVCVCVISVAHNGIKISKINETKHVQKMYKGIT